MTGYFDLNSVRIRCASTRLFLDTHALHPLYGLTFYYTSSVMATARPHHPEPSRSLPDPSATRHRDVHTWSYQLLADAHTKANVQKKYDHRATWEKMFAVCQEHTRLTPKEQQLDLAECMLLGLDAASIAGTGWGKTLSFVLPLFVPESEGKIVVIVSPLNALETDQVQCPPHKFHERVLRKSGRPVSEDAPQGHRPQRRKPHTGAS